MNKVDDIEKHEMADYFFYNIKNLKHITKNQRNELMLRASNIINGNNDNDLKNKYLNILYNIAFIDDMTLEECWQIYWLITSSLFQNSELHIVNGDISELYKYIYKCIEGLNFIKYPYRRLEERNQNKIIIITSQFLGVGHSPTLRVLDYSYTIKKYLKKDVFIINDSGLNFHCTPYLETLHFNYIDDYCKMQRIEYKGEQFGFYQVGVKMPNIDVISQIRDFIYEENPLFVFNIGASNITTDICTKFTTTVSLPCSFKIPITCSKYLLLGRQIEDEDSESLRALEPYQKVIETNINYEMRESNVVYTREQFGIPEDKFTIVIVGNRLDEELNFEFIELINKIIDNNDIHIAFVGHMNYKQNIIDRIQEKDIEKLHFLGSQSEASKLIKILDLYVNPKRSGGGRSSFEALYYGIPVVTLNFGDVYYTSGKKYGVNDYTQMYDKIIKYFNDKAFYENMREEAIKRAKILSNIKDTQQKMIEDILESEGREKNGKK